MKKFAKKCLIVLSLLFIAFLVTGCGKPNTLEEYMNNNKKERENIDALQTDSMKIEIKGNVLTYIYDTSAFGVTSEEMAKSAEMKSAFESSISNVSTTFTNLAKQLEDQTKISGISVKLKYVYNDYVIIEKTFTSN